MSYQPIENYGVIGDMHTVALIGLDGSIDWMCFPYFDSPSVFAAILDDSKGGRFRIAPRNDDVKRRQLYWPDTNVLMTRFLCPDGVAELTDFMPIGGLEAGHGDHQVIRRVYVARGSLEFEMVCEPAFNYARDDHETTIENEAAIFRSRKLALGLAATVDMERHRDGVRSVFTLKEGETATFVLDEVPEDSDRPPGLSPEETEEQFERTVEYWRDWLSQSTYRGRWREIVHRSALVLKLLTYKPTGAIVAAPTCSLPEQIGGSRNWDYRFTWIRDAAFTVYAFMRIGFTEEAAAFMNWVEARTHELEEDGTINVMYGLDGSHELEEATLDHLEGYRGSGPVRIGNGAYGQTQLDIYGELLDSVYLYNKYGSPISYTMWSQIRKLMSWLLKNWKKEDHGIWEVRSETHHFVYSKLMSWVAFDRAVRLADRRSFPSDREAWLEARDAIYEEIMAKGWNDDLQAFVQSYDDTALDAGNLMMPLVFFMAPNDPRMVSTIEAVMKPPDEGGLLSNSLVYRYNSDHFVDGVGGREGTFNICTFWLVEALTRAGRDNPEYLRRARLIFEKMLGFANHLGLYAEETGPTGEALGNFPQAFTHLALISAAYNLDRQLGEGIC